MKKIYFAHPVNVYNTALERAFEYLIAHVLAGGNYGKIENPNQPLHQEGYKKWSARQRESDTKHGGMNYFYDKVLPQCEGGCIALPFLDCRLGLGVAGETKWSLEQGRNCWIVEPTFMLDLEHLREFIKHPMSGFFKVGLFAETELKLLAANDPELVVPHEETRLRTWIVYGKKMRPYEEAHLVRMPVPEGFYPD